MNLKEQNILFVSRSTQFGGTEKIIIEMCEVLISQANSITVCSFGNIDVPYLNKLGIKHYYIPDIENKSPKTIALILRVISKIIETENITIIHSNHRMAAFYSQILSWKYKFISIATAHGIFFNKKVLTKFCYRHTRLIACGDIVKKNLINVYRINKDEITVIHNAIKIKETEHKPIADISEKKILIGNIGRLSEEKGQIYFILSIPEIIKRHPDALFLIIGDGDDKEKLKEVALTIGVYKYIRFLGYREDIINIISQLDIVVLTSLTEGLPLTPIEAFSQGTPMVATRVGGTVEIVHDGENGYLVKPKSVLEIAERINKLIEDNATYIRFSENAKKTYEKEYSFEVFKNRIISYYEKIGENK